MKRGHALLSPSASHRWLHCPGSVPFIEANDYLLPDGGGVFAAEGTKAHALLTALLKDTPLPADVPEEMDRMMQELEAFIRGLRTPGDRLLVDQRVSLFYDVAEYGSLDVGIMGRDQITILDLKYGAGVSVDAYNNTQLAIYAESFIQQQDQIGSVRLDMPVRLIIWQPRDRNNPEPLRDWLLSRGSLGEFCKDLQEVALAVLHDASANGADWARIQEAQKSHTLWEAQMPQSGLARVSDPQGQCRFCRAKGVCEVYSESSRACLPAEVRSPDKFSAMPDPTRLTREQRVRVIQGRKPLEQWLEAVEDQEVADLMVGAPPAGFKLVEGKSNRQWRDEGSVKKLLKNYLDTDKIITPGKLVSPAAVEKLLKGVETSTKFDNKLATLIEKPEGKPTLVPESDKREGLKLSSNQSGFEDLDSVI